MGLTKQYLRYGGGGTFGVVGTTRSNLVLYEYQGMRGRLVAVGACEHVFIWDLKTGEKVLTLQGDQHEVSVLARSPDKRHIAVGYANGSIKVFNLSTGQAEIVFSGHKSAVTALNYDKAGMRLVSGSSDTEVILWDIVNESGIYRLRGHKAMITQTRFLATKNVLVTSSKDTFIKFWDLDTEHCFRTLVGHKTEVWDFVFDGSENLLITGSSDSEIRVWQMLYDAKAEEPAMKKTKSDEEDNTDEDEDDVDNIDDESSSMINVSLLGSLLRQGKDRVYSMTTDGTGAFLACHGSDNQVEIFRINNEQEAKKHLQKKVKKAKKKQQGDEPEAEIKLKCDDYLRRLASVKCSSKVRSVGCLLENDHLKLVSLLANNSLETCQVDAKQKEQVSNQVKLSMPGHRSDVRTVAFSSDNTAILSASGEALKVWNRTTLQCIRTLKCDYALCSMFAPGDRHVIIGTKSGKLQIFDIAGATLLETIEAHDGAVWSISMAPDKKGLVSGSADHTVKFWDFELIADKEYSDTKRLTLVHTRTLKMAEDVLCVKYSPDKRLVAVALLDNTVKVFFADTLKFFLSLYGHKLPVLCIDISSDSSLLVTGSADRNIKLWGLDFGDCHKSIFAHDDSIMCLQFIPKTHMFFSGGKDRKLKQWNGDNYDHITTLEGHKGELWCLAISPSGNFVVTGSHDKSLRLWEKTQEPLVLEEEQEMEREKEFEKMGEGEETVVPGEATDTKAARAGKKTIETVKAAERIMEALELYKTETEKLEKHAEERKAKGKELPPPQPDPMMVAYACTTPLAYVLMVLKKVKSSELEESLLVLPIAYVWTLLRLLERLLHNQQEVELVCRCLFFLLKIHQGHITSNQAELPLLAALAATTNNAIADVRDTVGYNLAGLGFLKQQLESREEVFFLDATQRRSDKRKKAKKAAILTLKL